MVSTNRYREREKKNQVAKIKPTIADLFIKHKDQIAMALPQHLTADRMTRLVMTEIRKTPKLGLCDPYSLLGAVVQASQLGLEVGSFLGHVHLIPFENKAKGISEVQIIIGYKGLIDLVRRSGDLADIFAETIHKNDEFKYELGLRKTLMHCPAFGNRGELIGAYAVAHLKDGSTPFVVLHKEEIDKVAKTFGPWKTHYEEMAKKTAVRRLFKWLPMSVDKPQVRRAIELEEREEQSIDMTDSVDVLLETGIINELPPSHEEITDPKIFELRNKLEKHLVEAMALGFDPMEFFSQEKDDLLSTIKTQDQCMQIVKTINEWKSKNNKEKEKK
jgi:recombination protein RecT